MRFSSLALCAAFVLCASLSACNQAQTGSQAASPAPDSTQAPAPLFAHDASDLQPDPGITYGVLENGLRYAVIPNDTPTQTASMRLRFDLGSLDEREDQRGLAHFLEHMAFNGSQNVPEGEMVKILERAGLAFGPDTNASTGLDETIYKLDLPNVDDETLQTAFFLMRETADKLTISPEAVMRERGVVLSELRVGNTVNRRNSEANWAFHFPEARFIERLPIGLEEVITSAEPEPLRALYRTFYRPDRAFLVFAGDVEVAAVEARIAETFGDWRTQPDAPQPGARDLGGVQARGLEAAVFGEPGVATRLSLSIVRPFGDRPDTAENRKASLIENVAHSALNRRLQTIARSQDAPFLSAGVGVSRTDGLAEQAYVSVSSEPGAWARGLEAAESALRRAVLFGFSEAEIAEQLANYRRSYEQAALSADTRRTVSLAGSVLSAFGGEWVPTHPADRLALFEAHASDVTPEAVVEALRALWLEEGWDAGEEPSAWRFAEPLLFLSDPGANEDTRRALLEAFRASRAEPVSPPDLTSQVPFAYDSFGAPGEIVERRAFDELDIQMARFANNVRVAVKQTDFEDDVVRLTVRVGAGTLEVPQDKPGLTAFTNAIWSEGGLEAHTADALQSLLAGTTVGRSVGIGQDAFRLSGANNPEDLALQLKVFAAYLAHPAWREEPAERFRRSIPQAYERYDATPGGVLGWNQSRILSSGHPHFGYPPLETMLGYTSEEAAAYMARALGEGAIEIGIVGDVDPQTAFAAVAESFGALPPRRAEAADFRDAWSDVRFPEGGEVQLTHQGEPDQAIVVVAWPVPDGKPRPDDRAHQVRYQLLRGVLGVRLTDEVRERESATYSPSASLSMSRVFDGFGSMTARVDVTPEDVPRMRTLIGEIAQGLGEGISDDLLDRARTPILEQLDESEESNGLWLAYTERAWSEPVWLERFATRRESVLSVTPSELEAIARETFRPDAAVTIEVLPADPEILEAIHTSP